MTDRYLSLKFVLTTKLTIHVDDLVFLVFYKRRFILKNLALKNDRKFCIIWAFNNILLDIRL